MMDLISKLKMVFDTVTSFFQALNFVREYVKKHSENKKKHRSSGKN
ncbi:MAG: hypothetical protein J6S85_01310 [Methanobrevibacter sp.]|nr:hypothetical protein [Methanobrevibacter sp.]